MCSNRSQTGKIRYLELSYIYSQEHDFNKYHVSIFGFESLRCLYFGAVVLVHRFHISWNEQFG